MALDWTSDRRRTPRVDLLATLHGHLVALDEQARVTQLSQGGMTLQTTAPLSPRVEHDFRISLDDVTIQVQGRIVHSRVVMQGDNVSYVAGVEFIHPSEDVRRSVDRIIENVKTGVE